MCSDRLKNHGCAQKKQEGTSSAIIWRRDRCEMLRTQALFAAEPTTKMKSTKANFVTWTFRLSPKRQLSILLNFFFPLIDIWYFFTSLKLQHCRTIVLLRRLPKSTGRFPAKKRWHSPPPVGLPWDYPHPSPESLHGRTDGRTYLRAYADVRTKFSRIDWLPKVLSYGAPLKIGISNTQELTLLRVIIVIFGRSCGNIRTSSWCVRQSSEYIRSLNCQSCLIQLRNLQFTF